MTVEDMRKSCVMFKKLGGHDFEITRPEVECLWSVTVQEEPTAKQMKQLEQLGWSYHKDDKSFGQYF